MLMYSFKESRESVSAEWKGISETLTVTIIDSGLT